MFYFVAANIHNNTRCFMRFRSAKKFSVVVTKDIHLKYLMAIKLMEMMQVNCKENKFTIC